MAHHLHGGRPCKHPTKKACEAERLAARVRCEGLLQERSVNSEPRQCVRMIDPGDRYCPQHFASADSARRKRTKEAERRLDLDRRIAEYIHWAATHPSVWDRMPR